MSQLKNIIMLSLSSLVLVSCAASKPPEILQLPASTHILPLDSDNLQNSIGQTVRWGGLIIETKNNKDSAQVIILGYPLSTQARPSTYGKSSTRRFIAKFNHYIEPGDYSVNREITIIGQLDHIEESKVDDFNYQYPVVTVEKHALWEKQAYSNNYDNYNYRWSNYYPYNYWYYDRHRYAHHYSYH